MLHKPIVSITGNMDNTDINFTGVTNWRCQIIVPLSYYIGCIFPGSRLRPFICISHAILCISLDSIAVSLFTITTITTVIYYYSLSFIIIHYYHYYSLSKLFGVYCRPMDAIFMILCIGCWWQRLMADCSGVGASEPTFLPLSRRPTPSCPCS